MCLAAFAIEQSGRFPLVLASNRDEFFARPASRLAWWVPADGSPAVLSGRDLESGGTWLGLTAQGRLAFLTNLRSGRAPDREAPSRGRIVTDWLSARDDTGDFWMRTALSGYNGFNLIAADFSRGECFWGSNALSHPRRLDRGLHGISNGALDAPWPKVERLKAGLAAAIEAAADVQDLAGRLFQALEDRRIAADSMLPETGIPIERERLLSPAFIHMPEQGYGTRCSTLVITEQTASRPVTHVFERSFDAVDKADVLRHATLLDWPPRYVPEERRRTVELGEVTETAMPGVSRSPASPLKRTRVRGLRAASRGGMGLIALA